MRLIRSVSTQHDDLLPWRLAVASEPLWQHRSLYRLVLMVIIMIQSGIVIGKMSNWGGVVIIVAA